MATELCEKCQTQKPQVLCAACFCERIREALTDGYGFVPFVGSGLSVSAGIPTSQDILEDLSYCIHLIIDGPKTSGQWTPRKGKWPPKKPDFNVRREKWFTDALEALKERPKGSGVGNQLEIEAVCAMSNWRSALQFLSRLEYDKNRGVFRLRNVDTRVMDSFFLHLTRGKQPSSANIMLAHLADPMRFRTILTTNFDMLIEDAAALVGREFVTFDVHHDAGLPDPRLVLRQRSIVKLHGGRYGLRADYTLDDEPSDSDKTAFTEYLLAASGLNTKVAVMRNHIFVIGSSAEDQRSVSLITYAMDNCEAVRLFWVCRTAKSAARVREKFPKTSYDDRIMVTFQTNTDLFLFEVFQRLMYALPPGRASYPAFWTVPPRPYDITGSSDNVDGNVKALDKAITENQKESGDKRRVLWVSGGTGLSSVAAHVCEDRKANRSPAEYCIWVDISRLYGEEHMFAYLTSAIAQCIGSALGPPITLPGGDSSHRKAELSHYVAQSPRPIVLFLNGREGPDFLCKEEPNRLEDWESMSWFNRTFEELTPVDKQRKLRDFLTSLVQPKLTIVLMTWCEPPEGYKTINPLPACASVTSSDIAGDVIAWINAGGDEKAMRASFVFSMAMFRHAIHPSALCSWGLMKARFAGEAVADHPYMFGPSDGKDNDTERAERGSQWIRDLLDSKAIRERDGGFVWMHENLRLIIAKRIREHKDIKLGTDGVVSEAEAHEGIADWYAKLFRSSNDPCAAIESVRHRMFTVTAVGSEVKEEYRKRAAFNEAKVMLDLSRDRILSCGYAQPLAQLAPRISDICNNEKHTCPESGRLLQTCRDLFRDMLGELADFREMLKLPETIPGSGDREPRGSSGAPQTMPTAKKDAASSDSRPDTDNAGGREVKTDKQDYKSALARTGLRQYDQARRLMENLVNLRLFPAGKMKWAFKEDGELADSRTVRQGGRNWLSDVRPDQESVKLICKTLRRHMFLCMLEGQLLWLEDDRHRVALDRRIKDIPYDRYVKLFQEGEAAYVLATELMRHISDYRWLQKENADLRTEYGVLLANMGRFREAHRRLDEAVAYLAQAGESPNSLTGAVIDLRRSEVLLLQARNRFPVEASASTREDWIPVLTLVNSAQDALDRARREMAGHRKNVWWWTWAYELQVTVCAILSHMKATTKTEHSFCWQDNEDEELGLGCRACNGGWARCLEASRESRRIVRFDLLRQARLLCLLGAMKLDADNKPDEKQMKPLLDEIREVHASLRLAQETRKRPEDPLPSSVDCFAEEVAAWVDREIL